METLNSTTSEEEAQFMASNPFWSGAGFTDRSRMDIPASEDIGLLDPADFVLVSPVRNPQHAAVEMGSPECQIEPSPLSGAVSAFHPYPDSILTPTSFPVPSYITDSQASIVTTVNGAENPTRLRSTTTANQPDKPEEQISETRNLEKDNREVKRKRVNDVVSRIHELKQKANVTSVEDTNQGFQPPLLTPRTNNAPKTSPSSTEILSTPFAPPKLPLAYRTFNQRHPYALSKSRSYVFPSFLSISDDMKTNYKEEMEKRMKRVRSLWVYEFPDLVRMFLFDPSRGLEVRVRSREATFTPVKKALIASNVPVNQETDVIFKLMDAVAEERKWQLLNGWILSGGK